MHFYNFNMNKEIKDIFKVLQYSTGPKYKALEAFEFHCMIQFHVVRQSELIDSSKLLHIFLVRPFV